MKIVAVWFVGDLDHASESYKVGDKVEPNGEIILEFVLDHLSYGRIDSVTAKTASRKYVWLRERIERIDYAPITDCG